MNLDLQKYLTNPLEVVVLFRTLAHQNIHRRLEFLQFKFLLVEILILPWLKWCYTESHLFYHRTCYLKKCCHCKIFLRQQFLSRLALQYANYTGIISKALFLGSCTRASLNTTTAWWARIHGYASLSFWPAGIWEV